METGARRVSRGMVVAALTLSTLVTIAPAGHAYDYDPDDGRPSVYYISPRGADANRVPPAAVADCPGGELNETPWRTFTYALRCLDPGDVLYVRGGTYTENVLAVVKPASAASPILVTAYPGERPVLSGFWFMGNFDHWTIDGINVQWNPSGADNDKSLVMFRDGSNWTFRNAEVSGSHGLAGIYVATTGNGEPTDWRIEGNCVHNTYNTHGVAAGMDHNIYITTGLKTGASTIERNLIFNAPGGYNLKLGVGGYSDDGIEFVTAAYNTMHEAISNIILVGASHHNTIDHNLMGDLDHSRASWQPNIREYKLTAWNNVASHNRAYDLGSDGIIFDGDADDAGDALSPAEIVSIDNRAVAWPKYTGGLDCNGFHAANPKGFGRDGATHQALVGSYAKGAPDTPVVVNNGTWRRRFTNDVGVADHVMPGFGQAGDRFVVGDWNGDGVDTPGYVRGSKWVVLNGWSASARPITFQFGRATSKPVVGDWDGDGADGIGFVDGNRWTLRQGLRTSNLPTFEFGGCTNPVVISGRWWGQSVGDTPGAVCGNTWRLRGSADPKNGLLAKTFKYGAAGDRFVAGDWNRDGYDDFANIRGGTQSTNTSEWLGHSGWFMEYNGACRCAPTLPFSYDG